VRRLLSDGGELRVTLAPECRVTGQVVSAELQQLGGKVGWSNLELMRDGRSVAHTSSIGGGFDFVAPPGEYTLGASSEDLTGRSIKIVVPPLQSELALDPLELKASTFSLLKGKPAPELESVMGWSGKSVKLADLKGQYVLVEYWGFWCGPCIKQMPMLVELHEKFGGKGLTVVGVHMDLGGDVDTAAKLDEKMARVVKDVWKGKALPFPSALVSGKREGEEQRPGGTVKRYGITSFPTTVLIGPDGKIVGKFHARDIMDATATVEKLLGGKK
jgi:thiol-disulfide isomerase/thioredoxin